MRGKLRAFMLALAVFIVLPANQQNCARKLISNRRNQREDNQVGGGRQTGAISCNSLT